MLKGEGWYIFLEKLLMEIRGKTISYASSVATHFEKITHFEKKFSKCVKFGTKSTHFEIFFQSALNLGPT